MTLNVTVWLIDLAEPGVEAIASAVLTAEERARAARFVHPADQRRFVIGRAAMRGLLGQALDVAPARAPLAVSDTGKPVLLGPPAPISFNLSHSRDVAVLAIGPALDLGVDIEAVAAPADGVAQRFFAPEEIAALAPLSGDALAKAFTRIWTRKEAVLKAIGAGLRAPLDGFVVPHAPAAISRLASCAFDRQLTRRLQLLDCPVPDGFLASVAIAADDAPVALEVKPLGSLRRLLPAQ